MITTLSSLVGRLAERPRQIAYFGYLFAFVVATIACLGAAWRARSVAYADTRRALTWFFLGSAGWAGIYVGFLLAGPALWKHLFYQGSLIVGFGTVFAWLWFCSAYSGRGLHRFGTVRWFGAAVFVAVTALKVTNPWHGLYYGLEPTGSAFGLVVTHETLYWVVMALAYALAAAGYLMLFELFLKTDVHAGPLAALTGLTALPAALNVVGYLEPTLLDITHEPLGVAVFAIGLLFAYTYQFSAVRMAGSLDSPSLMLGQDGRIRDYGGGAPEIVPELCPEATGKLLGEVLPGLAEELGKEHAGGERLGEEHSGGEHPNGIDSGREGDLIWTRESEDRLQHFRVLETTLEGARGSQLFVLSDITEQVEREKALREAKEEAERAAQAKSSMLSNMSHEIRTPLTSIIGFAEAIGVDGEEASRFAPLIEKNGKRLLETLDGVLNLSKLQAGEMELGAEPIALAAQAEAAAEKLRPEAEEKGLTLEVEALETEISGSPVWAWADEGGVQIVLQNLLSNAIKYTEEGSVEVRAYQEEEAAVLEVEDTGIGMDPEVTERLFEPFRQASEGFSREYEGIGVGLTVTKQAAHEMDGQVEVKTQKGEGSRFTVRLPSASGKGNAGDRGNEGTSEKDASKDTTKDASRKAGPSEDTTAKSASNGELTTGRDSAEQSESV